MKNWEQLLITPNTSILDTMQVIDKAAKQMAVIVNENRVLLGIVTDGDIRRGILKHIALTEPVEQVMNPNPTIFPISTNKKYLKRFMKNQSLPFIPLVNENKQICDIQFSNEKDEQKKDNLVVLMAGGLGTRLRPLTENIPKPLLTVGDRPILETIIENFKSHGFYRFAISVNYKKEMIMDYFGNGESLGVSISYIHEDKRMGTAGALSLLESKPTAPIFVMNGDLLTKINYEQLLSFHEDCNSAATMCVREYDFQVPYGVIQTNHHQLLSIEEKPVQQFFVNGGIYVLNPEAIQEIPTDSYYDMPELFNKLITQNKNVTVFPIREYWLDIGRISDYEKANIEYMTLFPAHS